METTMISDSQIAESTINLNIKYSDSHDLRNKTLRVGILPGNMGPFLRSVQSDNGQYEGMSLELLNAISETLQFRYDLILPPDGEYGVALENGSFTGLVGMLQRGELDVAATDMTITSSRGKAIGFSLPFYHATYGILINAPKGTTSLDTWSWCSPFSWSLWSCFFGAFVVTSLILYNAYSLPWLETTTCSSAFQKFTTCAAYLLMGYLNKCFVRLTPAYWWAQTLLTCWWLLCLMEVASYGSFLIAILTAPPPPQLPFRDLAGLVELVRKGEYKICVRTGTSFSQALLDGHSGQHRILGQWLKHNPTYMRPGQEGCISAMQNDSQIAYMAEAYVLEAFQKKLCHQQKTVLLNDEFYPLPLMRMSDTGLINLWYEKYSKTASSCEVSDAEGATLVQAAHKRLSLRHLFSVFALFFMGTGLSSLCFLLEKCRMGFTDA